MLDGAVVRDYQSSDFERVRELHEASGIDYEFPDLSSPLFLVTKVFEYEGIVRACGGMYLQLEVYLFLDSTPWAPPQDKFDAIYALNEAGMKEAWLKGINQAVLWLPPGMERFGERLLDLGFTKDRPGWVSYSRPTQ
jgi:hypothetical protein